MRGSPKVKGAVGETARRCSLQVVNESNGEQSVVVRVTSVNLCHSHAAYATLLVDGESRATHVDLSNSRMRIGTEVSPGSKVELVVDLVDLHNGIMCLLLGEIEFELELIPLF